MIILLVLLVVKLLGVAAQVLGMMGLVDVAAVLVLGQVC
jgi:hypothetical protein